MDFLTPFLKGLGSWLEDAFQTLTLQKPLVNLSKIIKNDVAIINAYVTTLFALIILVLGVIIAVATKDSTGVILLIWGFGVFILLCMLMVMARILYSNKREKRKNISKIPSRRAKQLR